MKQLFFIAIFSIGIFGCSNIENKAPRGKMLVNNEKEFYKAFKWDGVKIYFASQKNKAINTFKIWTKGLNVKNDTIVKMANGEIYNVLMEDLNEDELPEIYVFVKSNRSAGFNEFYGFCSINNDSLIDIGFDNFLIHTLNGYSGFDTIYYNNQNIVWEYPIYNATDDINDPRGNRKIFFDLTSKDGAHYMEVDTVHNQLNN